MYSIFIIQQRTYVSVLPREGAPRLGRDSQLRVGRDTELYRILNMHYNKSNVYQVSASVHSLFIVFSPSSINILYECYVLNVR